MTPNPQIMKAVERLGYRVTVGDVAAQAGLQVNLAESGLLALASEVGGHLQVAESGEIVYLLPKNFRTILRNKYLQLQIKEWWEKVWRVLFYLIRISFGIVLVISILLIFVTILVIMLASSSSRDGDDDSGSSFSLPNVWVFPDFWWIFYPDYGDRYHSHSQDRRGDLDKTSSLNFLEAIFSFLFGDGNPNVDLEERRWQTIGTVIRNQRGAVVAEQVAPYLDDLGQGYARDYEEYMLPVLTRFNGRPEVSPEGGLVYHFPELQATAVQQRAQPVAVYLKEFSWRFSQASSGQIIGAIGLGGLNLVGAIVLGSLLAGGTVAAQLGGLVAFVQSIYWLLLAYGAAFLVIPLIRYLWIQGRNQKIQTRNQRRQVAAMQFNQADEALRKKIRYAEQFAVAAFIGQDDLAYTTEKDLIEQDIEQSAKIDAEWERRLREGE
jgi:hypothetical protein